MKVIAFAFLALAFFGTPSVKAIANNDVTEAISAVLDKITALLPELVEVKDAVLTLDSELESGTITVNELTITGLKDSLYGFDVDEANGINSYSFDWDFDEIVINLDLDLDVTGLIVSNSRLTISIALNDIKVQSTALGAADHREILDFSFLVTLGDTPIIVTIDDNEELGKFITESLSENLSEVINEITEAASAPISSVIAYVINIIFRLVQ